MEQISHVVMVVSEAPTGREIARVQKFFGCRVLGESNPRSWTVPPWDFICF